MACVMSTVIGFTKGTASGARIVLYLVRNFKSVSRSIMDLGPESWKLLYQASRLRPPQGAFGSIVIHRRRRR